MRTRLADLTRGLLALAVLAALLAGVPYLLVTAVGWPLPTEAISPVRILTAIRTGQVANATLIKTLALLVWAAWALFAVSVVVETAALARGGIAGRLPGAAGLQQVAARLVPAAMLIVSSLSARPAVALAQPAWTPASAVEQQEQPLTPSPPPAADTEQFQQGEPAGLYEVQRGDSLWDLAERHLGDGHRWREIRDLNVGRAQPDGAALGADDDLLRRGWLLALPVDAQLAEPAGGPGATVTVQPGDTLAGLAEQAYGDPDAYPALFDVNRGRPQPDGRSLHDPDLLRPGWQLRIPAADPDAAPQPAQPGDPGDPGDPGGSDSVGITPLPDPAAPAPPPSAEHELSEPSAPLPRAVPDPAAQDGSDAGADELFPDEQAAPPVPARPPDLRPPPTATASQDPDMTETLARPADQDQRSQGPSTPVAVGAAALGAAGVLLTLTRLRARQLRRRRPGRDVPLPAADLAQVERRLRAAAADAPLEWVDATLRLLTVRLRERPDGTAVPALLCVRAGELGVEVLLAVPDHEPPGGFVTGDGGYTWQLDPAIGLPDLQRAADDAAPVAPAVVSLGDTPEGPLLINLEYLPVLSVEGPAEQVQAFLAGVAVELTTAPWAGGVVVHTIADDDDDPIGRLPGVRTAADLPELAGRLGTLAEANRTATPGADSAIAARLNPDGEDWPPAVAVLRHASAEQLAPLAQAANSPGSGVVLVVGGHLDSATWRLQLSDDGTATLEPLGLRLTAAAGLDDATVTAAAGLLDLAAADDIARPTPLVQPDRPADEPDSSDDQPAPQLDLQPIEVAVLGPVTVTGWETPDSRPKLTEVVTYLAVQNRPVTTDKLRTALWPDSTNYNSFKTSVSRTRRALGADQYGAFHLPEAKNGRYQLGPRVGCDWTRFQTLAVQARSASGPHAVACLRLALELVQGPPFDGATYQWAFGEQIVSAIEVAVVDAACRLADLALDADDPALAIWATRQGHLVTPGHEGLYRAQMRAHAHTGDLDAVSQAFREAQRAAQALDPLDDVQPETQQLYQQLTRRQQAARGA